MALEGYIYREAPEGSELRSLLVRALVAMNGDDGYAWTGVASGLAETYVAWLRASEEEEAIVMDGEPSDYTRDRGPLITGDEAWRQFHTAWCARYASRLKLSAEAANDAYFPDAAEEHLVTLSLPSGVVQDTALALADQAVTHHRALNRMMQEMSDA